MTNAAWKLLAEWEMRRFTSPLPTLVERRTCQSLGIASSGLDELRAATSLREKAYKCYMTWPELDTVWC